MTRDEQIYEDRKTMTNRQLREKYGLSKQWIIIICNRQKEKENHKKLLQDISFFRNKYYKSIKQG